MENGYSIRWTSHSLTELEETIEYLQDNWTESELKNFASKLDHTIELISRNPKLFPLSNSFNGVRRAVVTKHNTIYYRVVSNSVEILSCFTNRKNPNKRKI